MAIPGCGGNGDGGGGGQGGSSEAHKEDAVEGAWWRRAWRTWRRSGHR
jgi:hypothetical protein